MRGMISEDPSTPKEFGSQFLGEYVIIRTYSAGVWFGILQEKSKDEVILKEARRMWKWHAKESISLSGVAIYGIIDSQSKIVQPVEHVWLQAIEIIPVRQDAIISIKNASYVSAE